MSPEHRSLYTNFSGVPCYYIKKVRGSHTSNFVTIRSSNRIGRSEKSSIDQLYTGLTGCTSRKDQLSLTQHRKCVAYMANVARIGGGKTSQAKGKQKSSSSSIGLPVSYPQDGQTGSYHRGPITQSELYHISGKCVHKIKHIIISVSFLKKEIIIKPQTGYKKNEKKRKKQRYADYFITGCSFRVKRNLVT